MPKPPDKRVFDIAATLRSGGDRRVLAISADSTVPDLYLALLGAFRWRGDYDMAERDYRVAIGPRVFELGKGSRTPLRRVLEVGSQFECAAGGLVIDGEVTNTYLVQSRRHFPKVLECEGSDFDRQSATWGAQSAMRREYRGMGPRLDSVIPREYREARLHGFFSAIVAGPMIMPSEWLPHVLDMNALPDSEAARDAVTPIMSRYNTIARQMYEDRDAYIATVENFAEQSEGEGSIEWARGFFDAIGLRTQEWDVLLRDDYLRDLMGPIAALYFQCGRDPEKRELLRDESFRRDVAHAGALAAIGLWEASRGQYPEPPQPVRRAQPKISPNAPCPCGSGKKYKRCCGSPLRVV